MRHERCEVQTNNLGEPAEVRWQGRVYAALKVARTYASGGNLSLREHWILDGEAVTLHVYSVEYGSAGHRTEKWWWLAGIDPDPRGFMVLM